MDEWQRMYEEAEQRGLDDYERGIKRQENPFDDAMPESRRRWFAGWDRGYALDVGG